MKVLLPITFAISALCLSPVFAGEPETLFDGKTLEQWTQIDGKPVTKDWEVVDGVIHGTGKGGDIITKKTYGNFEMTFEWKISEGGNSGVKYRAQKSLGMEYQVLDDEKHPDSKNPTHRTGSLYDLVAAPDDKLVKTVGEWNESKIIANGGNLEHWLNGVKVMSIDQSSDDWKERFGKSKYMNDQGFGNGTGHILLQEHNDEVWFRKLMVKELE